MNFSDGGAGIYLGDGSTSTGIRLNSGDGVDAVLSNLLLQGQNQTFTFPDKTGTFALTSDLTNMATTGVATLSSLVSIGTITTGVWNGTALTYTFLPTTIATSGTYLLISATGTLVQYSHASTTLWDKAYAFYNGTSSNINWVYNWVYSTSSVLNASVGWASSSFATSSNFRLTQILNLATTTGGIMVASGTQGWQILPKGTDNLCLTASSSQAFGLAWGTCGGNGASTLTLVNTMATGTISINLINATTTIEAQSKKSFPLTITKVSCNSLNGTTTLNIVARTESNPRAIGTTTLSSSLVCGVSGTASSTVFATSTMGAYQILVASTTAVIGTTTRTYIHIDYVASTTSGLSGTTGYIPKYTSGQTLGTSTIFQSGGNIGIGTSTPANLFSIATTTSIFEVLSTGKVGIGTSTVDAAVKFQVVDLGATTSIAIGSPALGRKGGVICQWDGWYYHLSKVSSTTAAAAWSTSTVCQ
jgi:hypothetical protein